MAELPEPEDAVAEPEDPDERVPVPVADREPVETVPLVEPEAEGKPELAPEPEPETVGTGATVGRVDGVPAGEVTTDGWEVTGAG